MGRFDRYILTQLMRVFGFFALILVGVYWVNRAVILLDRYLSEGQGGTMVLELTLLSLPSIMVIVLPIAGFVATAFATNRLYADGELVIMQATGFSNYRLARPFLMFSVLVALLLSVLAHVVVPVSMSKLNDLEAELLDAISARLLVPGTFQSPTKGVTVYVRDIQPDGTLNSLLVADRRDPDRESTYSATSAVLVGTSEGPRLVMLQGMAQTLERPGDRLSTTAFEEFTISLGGMIETSSNRRLDYRQLSTGDLLAPSQEILDQSRRSPEFLQREAHLRITQALLSIWATALGFAALMVGGFSRFGLWRQIILAIGLVVLVKLLDNAAIDIAKNDPSKWPIVYLSSVFSALLCLLLLYLGNGTLLTRLGRRRSA
ncbi:LPS export ABC transporter permease LptF [Pseudoruegeria sp. SK021]|uniref:LPS export ABC transporter permease LptF n=1 Tax=Pseudoruegeria sp. SK021 TaxID=1933035 RepID=UPI000A26330C|nr:LPS export ABC transporter permease LptF [Pseudoruegeria sp. SK021]OSP55502.1 LPS export ABC transporter permease LptF [Pseudoruegeria sp. SK021]